MIRAVAAACLGGAAQAYEARSKVSITSVLATYRKRRLRFPSVAAVSEQSCVQSEMACG